MQKIIKFLSISHVIVNQVMRGWRLLDQFAEMTGDITRGGLRYINYVIPQKACYRASENEVEEWIKRCVYGSG